MLLKLAWRNIWRNKRRSLITVASVFFAVILATLMMSLKEGMYKRMIESMVGSYMGYVQVHASGYWDEQSLDNSFVASDVIFKKINAQKGVKSAIARIESFAFAASDSLTGGSMVVGIDPGKEQDINQLNKRVSKGEYIKNDDTGVMMGAGLAKLLKMDIGDTIILIGQGYHGSSAAGKYEIKALINFGSPELSKKLIMMPIDLAKELYSTEDQVTNIIINVQDPEKAKKIAANLSLELGEEYEVMDWHQLTPELKQMIESDRVEGYVFMFILYMVIGFGIFGTMLMMVAERQHEFGVLVGIGMKRIKLAFMVWMEVVLISISGAIIGMLGAFPVCYYFFVYPIKFGQDDEMAKMYEDFGMEPVIQSSIDASIFIQQASIVTLLASVISIYAFVKILNMNAIKAMRS